MNSLATVKVAEKQLARRAAVGTEPSIFAAIYQPEVNIVIWQRHLANTLCAAVDELINSKQLKPLEIAVAPENTYDELTRILGNSEAASILSKDIALQVDMFCCLFDLKRAGLRLTMLDKAMCPRFHVDKIPCRLVSTYQGVATEWLAHEHVDRAKLGAGNNGLTDEESGLFNKPEQVQKLTKGDVALLKGENWQDTEGAGLVHRSPAVTHNSQRVLLTLDFM